MLTNQQTAKIAETTIAQSHISYTEAAAGVCAQAGYLRVGSGVACFAGVGCPFSQTIGWGFDQTQAEAEESLTQIEIFYADRGMATCPIELCPYTALWMPNVMTGRGYRLAEWSTIGLLDLAETNPGLDSLLPGVRIEEVKGKDALRDWAVLVSDACGTPEAAHHFELYALGRGIFSFVVAVDGRPCGGGTIGIHEGVCDLGLTGVQPPYRGRGLQKALLRVRLDFARERGARLACVTTDPGSISDLNVQKIGFQVAYTRVKLEKTL